MAERQKTIPNNINAEESLLGALLIDDSVMVHVINTIQPASFFSERNGIIFSVCQALYNGLQKINEVTVANRLYKLGNLEKCGGAAYLSHLVANCPTSLDAPEYAEIVRQHANYRAIILMGQRISEIGYGMGDIDQSFNKIDDLINGLRKISLVKSQLITPEIAGNEVVGLIEKYQEQMEGIPWGYRALDSITSGIYPEYILIGARPSIGKTQLMLDIADRLAENNRTVLYVSAEMTSQQLYERKISKKIKKGILELRQSGLTEENKNKIVDLGTQIASSKNHYLNGSLFLADVEREIMVMQEKGSIDVVFIDYLGALRDCYVENRENQNIRIGRVSNRIQGMVHRHNIPIIVAVQLNREIENQPGARKPRKPRLSDLRDSGNLEQDADVVLLLHRDQDKNGYLSAKLQIKMAKNRQLGAAAPIELEYNYTNRRYEDVSKQEKLEDDFNEPIEPINF